ncbi:MAG: hypothetical protein R3C02_25975 [Planctomycetaceae bacterium]
MLLDQGPYTGLNPLGYDVSQPLSWLQRLIAASLATLSLLECRRQS